MGVQLPGGGIGIDCCLRRTSPSFHTFPCSLLFDLFTSMNSTFSSKSLKARLPLTEGLGLDLLLPYSHSHEAELQPGVCSAIPRSSDCCSALPRPRGRSTRVQLRPFRVYAIQHGPHHPLDAASRSRHRRRHPHRQPFPSPTGRLDPHVLAHPAALPRCGDRIWASQCVQRA